LALTPEQVDWVAHLARLELSAGEREAMARQLTAVLDYIQQLQRVNTEGIEALAHPLPVHNVFREDTSQPSLPVADALVNAPDRRGDFYGVPAVLD
jgi:aspartyl-tRNA(Asn)/glutamyl-tRNA(Gln) amidotransferase subunit C